MWLTVILILTVIFFIFTFRYRPQSGLGIVLCLAFAFPIWVQYTVFEIPGTVVGTGIDVRLGISIVALVSYLFFKKSTYPWTFTVCDGAMLGLVAVHVISDSINSGFSFSILLRVYAEWYAPYVVGRLAFQYRSDLERLLPVAATVAFFLALVSIIEGVSGFNPMEAVFGTRPPEQVARSLTRWGLHRAFGPCLNPIYLGTLQILLFAWPLVLAIRALQYRAHWVWIFVTLVCAFGIVCTGSRGPVLGIPLVLGGVLFWLVPRSRIPALMGIVLLAATLFVARDRVINVMESWASESVRSSPVVLDGEKKKLSSARNRLLLFDLYRIALSRSGFFGFGTEAVTGFPVRVPMGPQEVDTLRTIRFIDNSYILITLRFGYLGLLFFMIAIVAAVYQFFQVSLNHSNSRQQVYTFIQVLAACLGSCCGVTAVILLTVFMPPEHGFVMLWTMGASSGLLLADRDGNLVSQRKSRRKPLLDSHSSTSAKPPAGSSQYDEF
jgi:O-Antigen ligase